MSSYIPPEWAANEPILTKSLLEVYKDNVLIEKIYIGLKAVLLLGRNSDTCDISINHPSISRIHCVFIHDKCGNIQFMDLSSTHGSTVDNKKCEPNMPAILEDNSVILLGQSTREYRYKLKDETNKNVPSQSPAGPTLKEKEKQSVRCRHILYKHSGSRRPTSWKTPVITITKEEAREALQKIRLQLLKEYDAHKNESEQDRNNALEKLFSSLAAVESDCSSYKRGGDLGPFTRGKMQKEFEEAAFKLGYYEMSDIVESESGVHIILRVKDL